MPGGQVRTEAATAGAARSTCDGAARETHQAEPRGAADPRRRVECFELTVFSLNWLWFVPNSKI